MLQSLAIILLCLASAVLYGILLDQVTARICVEYFTIGHLPIFGTDNPTLLGLGWGIVATWWVGLLLGVPLAFAARFGARPKCDVSSLIHPIAVLLIISALIAAAAGVLGWMLANQGIIVLVEPFASQVPREKHIPFLTDLWAHLASYLAGFIGGLLVIVRVWRSRASPRGTRS